MGNLGKEIGQGMSSAKKDANAKKDGYDKTHENRSDYDEGYERGKKTRDPKNTDKSGETSKKVRDEYKGKNKKEREAYKKGYASGSAE